MGCKGLHCDGCGGHGGLAVALVALVVVGAVLHAIWRQLVEVVEITGLVILSLAGLALAAGAVYAAVWLRARMRQARARQTIPARAQVIQLGTGPREAIEAPRQRAAGWPLPGWWEEIKPSTDRRTP